MLRYTRPKEMDQLALNKLEDRLVSTPEQTDDGEPPKFYKKDVTGLMEHIAYLEQKYEKKS